MENEPQPSEPVPLPRVARRKRMKLLAGAAGVVILLLVVALGWWWLNRSGELPEGGEQTDGQGQLPLAQDQVPGDNSVLEPVHVGVELAYTNEPELGVELTSVKRTDDRTTIEFYEPASAEVQQAVLQLLDGDGQVITETPFIIPSSFIVDFAIGEEGANVPAGDGTLYLVLPVPQRDQEIRSVRIVGSDDEREFDRLETNVPLSRLDGSGPAATLKHFLGTDVRAQPAPDGVYTVVVMNEVGSEAQLQRVFQKTQEMAGVGVPFPGIKPWDELVGSGKVQIVSVQNSTPLGCTIEQLPGRLQTFAVCRDHARVFQAASALRPDWDTILVAHGTGSTGTAFLGSQIATVSRAASSDGIAHEFGHSIGNLRDEYGYLVNGYQPQPGPPINCFPSQVVCEQQIAPYVPRGAQCADGCEQVGQWRPATGIMHGGFLGGGQYGPLEHDLVRNAILARIAEPPPPTPTPTPVPEDGGGGESSGNGRNLGVSVKLTTGQAGVAGGGRNLAITMRAGQFPDGHPSLGLNEFELVNEASNVSNYRPIDGQRHYIFEFYTRQDRGVRPSLEVPVVVENGQDLRAVMPFPSEGVQYIRVRDSVSGRIVNHTNVVVPPVDRQAGRNVALKLSYIDGFHIVGAEMTDAAPNRDLFTPGPNEDFIELRLERGERLPENRIVRVARRDHGDLILEIPEGGLTVIQVLDSGTFYFALPPREPLRAGGPRLSIEGVERTDGRLTAGFYAPAPGEVHSLLQVMAPGQEDPVVEVPFTMPTEALAEAPGAAPQLVSIPESTVYLVVPIPDAGVSEVRVAAPSNGAVIDRYSYSAGSLFGSEDDPTKPPKRVRRDGDDASDNVLEPDSVQPEDDSTRPPKRVRPSLSPPSWWERLIDSWRGGFDWLISGAVESARAASRGNDDVFTILVINEVGGEDSLANVAAAAEAMIQLRPWSEFAGRVNVEVRANSTPLNCTEIDLLGTGVLYPLCPDSGAIVRAANDLLPDTEWDTIVVVTGSGCGCGTVAAPPITAVGSQANSALLVHELGHSVADMADEYTYQFGGVQQPSNPNCFDSENSCREALEPFTGEPFGACSLGCNLTGNWRPASRIMHNTYQPLEFGPYEKCLMKNAIAVVIGDPQDERCDKPPEEEEDESDPGFYWGWRR